MDASFETLQYEATTYAAVVWSGRKRGPTSPATRASSNDAQLSVVRYVGREAADLAEALR